MHRMNTEDTFYINLVTAEDAFAYFSIKNHSYNKLILQDDGVITLLYYSKKVRDFEYNLVKKIKQMPAANHF